MITTLVFVVALSQPQKPSAPKAPAKAPAKQPEKPVAPKEPAREAPPAAPAQPTGEPAPTSASTGPLVAFPHPLITEVLYAVPTGDAGDANGDGVRDTNGDEFIELVNPHDKPIRIGGYVLSGKAPEGKNGKSTYKSLRFTLPPLELKPGEVVVVFNGHDQKWKTPPGDLTRTAAPDPGFSGARVFTMAVESARVGLANKADYVLLTAPSGEKVECVKWGEIKPPEGVKLVEEAPDAGGGKGSVTRLTATGPLEPHPSVDGKRFSPGRFPLTSAER
jgi:hypothetical protein